MFASNRRALVIGSLAAALVVASALVTTGTASAQERKRNLLIIGEAKGYQHESITDAMATLYKIGRESGKWDTCFRTDCRNITKRKLQWEAKNLDDFDAVVFFTDGDLGMDESQKSDLLTFVRDDGKGFIGIHSAAITFTRWPEYGKMIGGYFDGHPWNVATFNMVVEDPAFPGMKHFKPAFVHKDEIYQYKNFSRDNVRVLLRLDAAKLDMKVPGVKDTYGGDFPVIWAREYGKGRVLYNGLGHVREVWDQPEFQKMWLEMVQWSMGLIPGDATPRPMPASEKK